MKNAILLAVIMLLLSGFRVYDPKYYTLLEDLSPGIHILDKEKPIDSLDEFKYQESLHQYLDKHNIELVYLNSDKEIDEETWLQFIEDHKLLGYHLRLSNELKQDLVDREIFIPQIPQYMVIDKLGNFVENNALRPSDQQELYDQLSELLK